MSATRPLGPITVPVRSIADITLQSGAKRELITLACGHEITRAKRAKRPRRMMCPDCAVENGR